MLFIYLRGVVRGCEYILRQNHKDIFLRLEDTPRHECHSNTCMNQGQKIRVFHGEIIISKWYGNYKKYAACHFKFIRFVKADRI